MRSVTFSFRERMVLVPVEIALIWRLFAVITLALFILAGIGQEVYSFSAAWTRGLSAAGATVLAILAGALATPALLPWIPGRQFWVKGAIVGVFAGLIYLMTVMPETGLVEKLGIWIWIIVAASYMAMNFTGATPYTSLSGVEREMRKGVPVQCIGVFLGILLWMAAPFID